MLTSLMMIKRDKIFSSVFAGFVSAALVAAMIPLACASASAEESAVTSTRSFPKITDVKRDLFTESTSTDVDANSHWGGIESLNVPQTKSAAELALEQARQQQQQAQNNSADGFDAAASRSGARNGVGPMTYFVAPPDNQSVSAMLNFAAQFLGKVPYRSGLSLIHISEPTRRPG